MESRRAGLPRTVGVIGGGTAGYFAALALKRAFPALEVTLVESSAVPIIGVGEATTTLMPPFLHAQLGLDVVELFEQVRPTFKLGIKFVWGDHDEPYFPYPFGDADPVEAFAHDGHLREQSLVAMLMGADRAPLLRNPDGELLSLLPRLKFAYHLDNAPFVAFLRRAAQRAGIAQVDLTIADVVTSDDRSEVRALRGRDGRECAFDLYVDASGFRSLLLEGALGSPFESYASSLLCDRAIVATVPQRGAIEPYTTAETMDAGWCWRIPVEGEDHRGYVHSSAFLDEEAAIREMRAKNPGMGEPWVVRFRSGRHREFWRGNVVAVGNAYGFVEPLESTALHMVIVELAYLIAGLDALRSPDHDGTFAAFASESVGAHWDYLRWFLAVHYRYNRRLDTPFWRAARAEVDVSGLAPLLARFEREGAWDRASGVTAEVGDPAFGHSGLMMMLLGQRVSSPAPTPALSREAWRERVSKQRGVVGYALEQGEALRQLRAHPELLARLSAPGSWCRGAAERALVNARERQPVGPRSGMPAPAPGDELLRPVR